MKTPLAILAVVAIVLIGFQLFAPTPGPDALKARTDLPWQITLNDDGGSRVFDLDLGKATLADAMHKFGGLEALALFEPASGRPSLEAFFGNVQFGPLQAKVVAKLEASDEELQAILARSTKREGSPSGDWKHPLPDAPKDHMQRRVTAITYVPATRGLDAEFFRSRFGEPTAWIAESEEAVSWFYPDKGLSILIDNDSREILEYLPPRDFVMPDGVTYSASQ